MPKCRWITEEGERHFIPDCWGCCAGPIEDELEYPKIPSVCTCPPLSDAQCSRAYKIAEDLFEQHKPMKHRSAFLLEIADALRMYASLD